MHAHAGLCALKLCMKIQLLFFPEGTDRGDRAVALSNEHADKNGLPRQVLYIVKYYQAEIGICLDTIIFCIRVQPALITFSIRCEKVC